MIQRFFKPAASGVRRWRAEHIITTVEHDAVVSHIVDSGVVTPRYLFMTMMSCGIAILGLLQSSAAVVIGAMLISPLMGPIMQFGLSLCVVDFRLMRRALTALAAGVALALFISILVVKVSPLREATSEIIARTQPTLFDLMVAVFSGLAGAYAAITRKGETIVGVAIATALMPPLAVVGYGIAVGSAAIAGNAFFLFMTNLLAIALSVTLVAKWYGFGVQNSPQHTVWQGALIALTFLVLAVPLGIALRDIAASTWAANAARLETEDYLKHHKGGIDSFRMDMHEGQPSFNVVAFVPHYIPDAPQALKRNIEQKLGKQVRLQVHQTLEASDRMARERADMDQLRVQVDSLEARTRAMMEHERKSEGTSTTLKDHILAQFAELTLAEGEKIAVITLNENNPFDEERRMALEQRLADAEPEWTVLVRDRKAPPKTPEPAIELAPERSLKAAPLMNHARP
jgi:uncharacterized hydrophobic protein (TIGR00271 family)